MKLTYLGQEGFLIECEGKNVLTDPYLSDYVDRNSQIKDFEWKRAYPVPVRVGELPFIDAVFLTHDHDDHTDPDTVRELLKEKPNSLFYISRSKTELLALLGVKDENILGVEAYKSYPVGELCVIPIPAAHEQIHQRREYGENVFDELGYLFVYKNICVFHAGDTLCYDGLPRLLEKYSEGKRLVLLLPVNGGDQYRREKGIIGNMDVKDALWLSKECGAELLIPMHHDLYPSNGVTCEEIISKAKEAEMIGKLHILKPSSSITL